jgi:hypothetical protein
VDQWVGEAQPVGTAACGELLDALAMALHENAVYAPRPRLRSIATPESTRRMQNLIRPSAVDSSTVSQAGQGNGFSDRSVMLYSH